MPIQDPGWHWSALPVVALAFAMSMAIAMAFPLVDPDEGRNAEVAREMVVSGDLVVPQLAGMPYLDKPPGFFWAAAAAIGLLGTVPWAPRLPAALAGAIAILLLHRACARTGDVGFATRAALLLALAPLFAVISGYVIFDIPLALCVTVVWTGLLGEVERGAARGRRLAMFAAVTAGILIKGPVMLAWAAGGSLGAALFLRSRLPLSWLGWWPGWALVLAVAGGWFALASIRHPEYPRYAFLEESFERLTSGSFKRSQPFWFAPVVLLAGALPWSLSTPWTRPRAAGDKVALGFVCFALVFFTLSRSKLVTYLLPAFPPLAWLAARAWSERARLARGAWTVGAIHVALGAGFAACALPGLAERLRFGELERQAALALGIAFALVGLFSLAVAIARRPALAFGANLAFTPLVLLVAGPALRSHALAESGAPLAQAIAPSARGGKVRYEDCYSPGTDFLLRRRSDLLSRTGDETTSNYQLRYRETLIARGQWRALSAPPPIEDASVIVRPAGTRRPPPEGGVVLFRDDRFIAYGILPERIAGVPKASPADPGPDAPPAPGEGR